MNLATRARLIITGIVLVWFLACAAVFTLGLVLPAWPRWLELPWSGFDDFAVTPDGKVLVYTSFFSRLLVYDLEGDFVVSLPGLRSRGMHQIAVDNRGRIYIAANSEMCVMESTSSGNHLRCRSGPSNLTGWRLDAAGKPESVVEPIPDNTVKDGIVQNGEILTAPSTRTRKRFMLGRKGFVERIGDRLYIHAYGEKARRVSTPWYLYWAKFPFPVFLSFVGLALCELWDRRSSARSGRLAC